MMKRKIFSGLIAVIMVLCLSCSFMIVPAAVEPEYGSLTVQYDPSLEGNVMAVYTLGDVSADGKFVLDSQMSGLQELLEENEMDLNTLKTADETAYAALLAQIYLMDNESVKPFEAVSINAEGKAVFEHLPRNKLYIVIQPAYQEQLFTLPILITVPYDNGEGISYDIQIKAKNVRGDSDDFRGAVILHKVGDHNEKLPGAEFSLWKKHYYNASEESAPEGIKSEQDDYGVFYWELVVVQETDGQGLIIVNQLPFGTYRFIETKAPDGYILDSTPQEFIVSEDAMVTTENNIDLKEEGKPFNLNVINVKSQQSFPESSNSEPEPPESTPGFHISVPGTEESNPAIQISVPDSPSQPSNPSHAEITGDDIVKYIVIGAIVLVSLGVIILLFIVGGKKDQDKKDNK